MDWMSLYTSFMAFHINGANQIAYMLSNNKWYFLIALAAAMNVFLRVHQETEYSVREEQVLI